MPDNLTHLHRETGCIWDLTAALYERDEARDIERLRAGWTSILPAEEPLLRQYLPCDRALHLQCAGGVDTLSLWKLGARLVVGIDISERMIAVAKRKASALGAPATFVACDVLDTPRAFDRTANLVYTGKGALPWMMDLDAWAGVVARLLAPNGHLFVHEGHPLDRVWDLEAEEYRLSARTGSYFQAEPVAAKGAVGDCPSELEGQSLADRTPPRPSDGQSLTDRQKMGQSETAPPICAAWRQSETAPPIGRLTVTGRSASG